MNAEKIYKEALAQLKRSEDELTFDPQRKEGIKAAILDDIQATQLNHSNYTHIQNLLFSWVEKRWLRWSLSIASLALLVFFAVQQLSIHQQMKSIEHQLNLLELSQDQSASGLSFGQKVLLRHFENSRDDSIMISRSDLDKLLYLYQHELDKNASNKADLKTDSEQENFEL